ncbi:MAG: dihydrofolate reductase family protein [Cytophagales bacterium]|nr:dihydrofolate reductase family protein [Cytophagales bacterium]
MPKIVYYVATSLDGYIAGPNEDISLFVYQGNGVEQYQKDLLDFSTVIMGRRTYEFGYQYGLKPGQPAYPHMEHHIFSDSLEFTEEVHPQVHLQTKSLDRVQEVRDQSPTDVYLCGGGVFAGWLLENDLIDQLKVKLNPIILGGGTRLFGNAKTKMKWELVDHSSFEEGLQILTYEKSQ